MHRLSPRARILAASAIVLVALIVCSCSVINWTASHCEDAGGHMEPRLDGKGSVCIR